jgi:hypothetical protein
MPVVTGFSGSLRWYNHGQLVAIPVNGFHPYSLDIGQIIQARERTIGFPVLNDCDGLLRTDTIDIAGKRFDISRIDINRIRKDHGRNRQQYCKE